MKRTQKARYFILGVVVTLIFSTMAMPALAANISKQLTAYYRDIKLVVDGVHVTPKDASGNDVEPFVADGTTYLPVRALAEALGKSVEWDGETSTVYVGKKPGGVQYMPDVISPYQQSKHYGEYSSKKSEGKEHFMMAGVKYTDGIKMGAYYSDLFAIYNLNGQYSKISAKLGCMDEGGKDATTLYFIGDGKILAEFELTSEMYPQDISVDVSGVLQLKIEAEYSRNYDYCLANAIIE